MSRLLRSATPGLSLAFAAVVSCLLLWQPCLHAIDLNGNTISDVYESLYPLPPGKSYDDDPATGNLCEPIREDITVGPYTNREKALLGVPLSAKLPMRLSIETDVPGNSVRLSFPTQPGKLYQVQTGAIVNLPPEDWIVAEECGGPVTYTQHREWMAYGQPIEGVGEPASIIIPGVPLSGVSRYYSYVCIGDVSSDADDLNDWEEAQLGTNPFAVSSDGDPMSDDYEWVNGLNPLADDSALDLDGDGVTNASDAAPANGSVGALAFEIVNPAEEGVLP